jgi:uncharacterized OB-fold protein
MAQLKLTHEDFIDSLKKGELKSLQCDKCRLAFAPPRLVCPECHNQDLNVIKLNGRGEVTTYTIIHYPPSPFFAPDVPYVVGLIRMEEGPQFMARIREIEPKEVHVGLKVRGSFVEKEGKTELIFIREK